MEVAIISVESIKPASPVNHLKPIKLSLLDQLAPAAYAPIILFYPVNDPHLTRSAKISNDLKFSLSKLINSFYALSGRLKDNLFIHDFNKGVQFVEARVKCRLFDFLQDPQIDAFNKFLPCEPFCLLPHPNELPQIVVQANIFDCGGIALGCCCLHKINDGVSAGLILKTWAAIANGSYGKVVHPNFSQPSLHFPPIEVVPPTDMPFDFDTFWFGKRRLSTRRFVFNANAIAALRAKSKSDIVKNPTRVEALSAFIWKSGMAASKKTSSGSPRFSVLNQAVNIRGLTKPRFPRHAVGNLYFCTFTDFVERDMELHDLVAKINECVSNVNSQFLKALVDGENGKLGIFEHLNKLEEISKANPQVFTFTSWQKFGLDSADFGWGKPVWTGLFGAATSAYPTCSNFTVLKHVGGVNHNAMEAWMTLDEEIIDVLENDPEFLAFASPNPSILVGDYAK